jgi:hypothetical protein
MKVQTDSALINALKTRQAYCPVLKIALFLSDCVYMIFLYPTLSIDLIFRKILGAKSAQFFLETLCNISHIYKSIHACSRPQDAETPLLWLLQYFKPV